MTSCEEKKSPPPVEGFPGGVFPDEIDAIKKKARGGKLRRLKIPIAVATVLLVTLAAVGGTLLGLRLNSKPNLVTRSVQLTIENEIVDETVQVDEVQGTQTYRTVSPTGSSYVIRDKKRGLSAYRFDDDEKCYILYESLAETEDVEDLLKDLEKMEEGEIEVAKRRAETFLTVDEDRGQVDRAVLSESMVEFCEGLHTHWAVMSSSEPSPTPTASAVEEMEASSTQAAADEENEATPTPSSTVQAETSSLMEVLSGINGTNAVHHREKRSSYCSRCCRGCHYCDCSERIERVSERCCTSVCARWGWLFRSGRCLRWETRCSWCYRYVYVGRKCDCQRFGGGGGDGGGRDGGWGGGDSPGVML